MYLFLHVILLYEKNKIDSYSFICKYKFLVLCNKGL